MSNGGTPLPEGTYTLIAANNGGVVAGAVTSAVALSGDVPSDSTVSITGGRLVLTVTSTTLYPPVLGGIGVTAGQTVLTFNGANGQTYQVLTSTNAAEPFSNWVSIASGTLTGSTLYFTNGPATNAQQFYIITSP